MVTATQFTLVYDVLSFSLATMMATTIFLWMRVVSWCSHGDSCVPVESLSYLNIILRIIRHNSTAECTREVQKCFDHFRIGHLHCGLPLPSYLQFVDRSLRMDCRRRTFGHRKSVQRRVPIHGLATYCSTSFNRNHPRHETTGRRIQIQSNFSWSC